MNAGWFITIDGPGGAGKSTLTRTTAAALNTAGIRALATAEPSHGLIGELARHNTHLFRGHALACLVAADRYHHLEEEIRPALAAGTTVVCDRYLASSLVLQTRDGVAPDFITTLHAQIDRPDLAVILTSTPDELRRRVTARGSHGRFEDDPGLADYETSRYQEVAQQFTADGIPVLYLDSTTRDAEMLCLDLVDAVQALPSPPP